MSRTDRQQRRERYEALVAYIAGETGGPDSEFPPGLRETTIGQNRTHAGEDWSDVKSALRAAVENGDLYRYRDHEGYVRYCPRTVEGLLALVATEDERPNTDQGLVAECNAIIQALREDADE